MVSISRSAWLFIGFVIFCGLSALSYGALQVHPVHLFRFGTILAIALVASRLKLKLPGVNGNMSVNLPFILIAVAELSSFEALMVALVSTGAQCFSKDRSGPKVLQTLFNVSTAAIAAALAGLIFQHRMPLPVARLSGSLLLALAGATFFLVQTIPVATVIGLTEGGTILRIWSSIVHLSFPYYVLSAGVASVVTTASQSWGWLSPLLLLAVMYGVYQSYRLYFGRPEPDVRPFVMAEEKSGSMPPPTKRMAAGAL